MKLRLVFPIVPQAALLDSNPFISCQTLPPSDVIVDSAALKNDGSAVKIEEKKNNYTKHGKILIY